MRGIDLFAGSGWGVACRQLGIDELGVEIMPAAVATRRAAGMRTLDVSVADLDPLICTYAPLQIASPPCQTFSMAGKGAGRAALDEVLRRMIMLEITGQNDHSGGDPRTWLVLEPLRLALHGLPPFIVWEQVPSVLPVWEAAARALRRRGYSVWTGNLHTEQYGVPQTRKRALLIARRDGIPALPPVPTHSRYYPSNPLRLDPDVKPWVTMAEALGWGMSARPSMTVTGGGASKGFQWTFERPATTVQGDPRIWPPGHKVNADDRRRLGAEADRRYGDRAGSAALRVTVAEAAALQTFPSDHPWQGNNGEQHLQVGNAVPPLFAQAVLAGFLPSSV